MKWEPVGRIGKVFTGATFNCRCGSGVIANGIAYIRVDRTYQFSCAKCNRTHRATTTGQLYRVAAA